jgi:proline iminopeptidase
MEAEGQWVQVCNGLCEVWYRVWGQGPIRVLFFHGGPGQAVVDYGDSNQRIFDPSKFTLVEVDQPGTGWSRPSVRSSLQSAEMFLKVTPQDVAASLLTVVDTLKWDKVYLHGGSWGSTLALLFAELFPERVDGMVLRGIFLGTIDEFGVTFSQKMAIETENIKESFSHFYEFCVSRGYKGSPDDTRALMEFNLNLFCNGPLADRDVAAWNWWVHELWAMDEKTYQFNQIVPSQIEEARSVAFWEAHIGYQLCFGNNPVDLIAGVSRIPKVPIEIVHGKGDFLCPVRYAQRLEEALLASGHDVKATYIESGHKVVNAPILEGVKNAVNRYAERYFEGK